MPSSSAPFSKSVIISLASITKRGTQPAGAPGHATPPHLFEKQPRADPSSYRVVVVLRRATEKRACRSPGVHRRRVTVGPGLVRRLC
jgi:hypothetical protein